MFNQKEYYKKWRQKNKEKRVAYQRKWEQEHREQRRKSERKRRATEDRGHRQELQRKSRQKLKMEILLHYSGGTPRCVRCLIDDINVLCIDHIEGGGYKERQGGISRGGYSFYQRLKKLGYPKGYQVLCANCNLKKLIEEGK